MQACDDPQRWQPSLSAMVDGEAPQLPRARVEAHLSTCPECAEWFDRARAQQALLRSGRGPARDLTRHLAGVSEAHLCDCHRGGRCECTDCVCPTCTCHG